MGTFGSSGKNMLRGPRYFDTDLGLLKDFAIVERVKLQFRAEFFNAFNHPQFTPGSINTVTQVSQTSSRNFLEPQLADFNHSENFFSSNPRVIQLFARFVF